MGAWLLVGTVGLLLVSAETRIGFSQAQAVIAGAQIIFAVWVFWTHGGRQITAAGVVSLAQAVFVGYAGLWWLARHGAELPGALFAATTVAYFAHVLMWGLFWRTTGRDAPALGTDAPHSDWATTLGLGVVAIATIAAATQGTGTVVSMAASTGVILTAIGLLTRGSTGRLTLARALPLAGIMLAYINYVFSGYGRLTIVVLALGVAIVGSTRLQGRRVKALVVAGAPLLTALLVALRLNVVEQEYGSTAAQNMRGAPDSFVTPLQTLARLFSSDRGGSGEGAVLWADLTVWVPRAFWPGKPEGFGQVLTAMFEPQLLVTQHTMAGLMAGEWFFDFGWLGVALMVLVVGFAVRHADLWLGRRLAVSGGSQRDLWWLAVVVVVVAGLPDLAWNGGSTYLSRTFLRLLPLLALLPFASKAPRVAVPRRWSTAELAATSPPSRRSRSRTP